VLTAHAQFVQQGSKLVGTGASGSAYQGVGVSLSDDGSTALVGGYYDNFGVGAAWCYTKSGGVWTQQGTKLVGTGNVGQSQQGTSVSLSGDGNTAVVGGFSDNAGVGAAWIFTRSGGVWTQQGSKLVGSGSVGPPYQGVSVAISDDGNTVIVGGPGDSGNVGAAWVYTRSGGVWTQQGSKLVGSGAVAPSYQGQVVSISADGNTAMVGGYGDNGNTGAAWVFVRSGGVWSQQGAKLIGTGATGSAWQGSSVSLSDDGNTAVEGGQSDAGSRGAAWVFTRSGGVWTQQGGKLWGSGGALPSFQGYAVSVSGDGNTLISGGYYDSTGYGAAWIFTRVGGAWTQLGSKLIGAGAVGSANQAQSVSLSGDGTTALIGGFVDNGGVGSAWIFTRLGHATITGVSDIPGDQGGELRLRWDQSPYDNTMSNPQVASYSIWRKPPAGSLAASKSIVPERVMAESSIVGFDYLATVPAVQSSSYQIVVPTLADSSASGTPYYQYVVSAHTTDLDVTYFSERDSGYSVDNLSPIPPAGLVATAQPGPSVELDWNPPTDDDVQSYAIYRSPTSGFTPSFGTMIGTSSTTSFTDAAPAQGAVSYYKLVAVDVHDNPSAPSSEAAAPVPAMQTFGVRDKWNMISVPLAVSDYAKSVVFPTATSSAFAYEGGYVASSVLANGRGYWVKFAADQNVSIGGLYRTLDTIDVAEGWNMVGSLSASMAVANIASVPAGIVTSNFFGYDAGYQPSATLEPGRGYWVKASQAGLLILNSTISAPPASRIRVADAGELPPAPPDAMGGDAGLPAEFALRQNYPNPFNPSTRIEYALPVSAFVTIRVYDVLGQEVALLVNETQAAGYRSVEFDANTLPSGVYAYTITAGNFTSVRKMLLVK
jgi:hypothetical protein